MKNSSESFELSQFGRRVIILTIGIITGVAFIMRFKGIWFGYPLTIHPDEHHLVNSAINIVKTHDLHPHTFVYPSLNIYLQAIAYSLLQIYHSILGHPVGNIAKIDYYLVGRTVTVLLSVATVYITYEMGKRLFNEIIGILAAFFVCMSSLHLSNSYTITVDSPVAFWSSLSMLMAIRIYKDGGKKLYYLLAGIFAGCAVGCKYTAVFAILPMVAAHIYHVKNKMPKEWIDGNLIYSLLIGAAAFFLTTPYALLDLKEFFRYLAYQRSAYAYGHAGFESESNFSLWLYLSSLYKSGYGILPAIFALIGLIWLLVKDYWKALLIIIFPFTLILFLGLYKTFFPRNIVAVIPFLAILTGVAVYNMAKIISEKTGLFSTGKNYSSSLIIVIVLITMIVSYSSSYKSFEVLRRATLSDTTWIATKWFLENYKTNLKIAREAYTPPLEEYSGNYQVINMGYGGKIVSPQYENVVESVDYVLLSSRMYDRYINNPSRYPEVAKWYNGFFEKHVLVKEFMPDGKTTGGHTIRIYKTSSQNLPHWGPTR